MGEDNRAYISRYLTTEHGYQSGYTTITTYHADMTFGMITFLIWTALRLESWKSGVWHMKGEDRKALGALAMSFFFVVQIWDSDRQVFSIAVGLINEGLFFL